jgi:hypothetical protein
MSKRKADTLKATTKKKKPRTTVNTEINDDLFTEITTKGRRMLPNNPDKYMGSITEKGPSDWRVRFRHSGRKSIRKFKTKEAAEAYKLEVNIMDDLIKNIVYEHDNEYYCVLTQQKLMRFSLEDLQVVDEHTWYAHWWNRMFYATTRVRNEEGFLVIHRRFHQLIPLGIQENDSCVHRNNDGLDNRRENLRINHENSKIELAKEPDPLFEDVTTHGRRILPTNRMKYSGGIHKRGNVWVSKFGCIGYGESQKSHKTEEIADAYIKAVNIRENLKIDNIIYEHNNEYYCVLTQQKLMRFSIQDLNLVQEHTWCAKPSQYTFYAMTNIKNDEGNHTTRLFHQLIPLNIRENETCDHQNRDGLDNRRENLRSASASIQIINQRIQKNNTTGKTGVSYDKGRDSWNAIWSYDNVERKKSYSVSVHKDEARNKAFAHREYIERTLPNYKEALQK